MNGKTDRINTGTTRSSRRRTGKTYRKDPGARRWPLKKARTKSYQGPTRQYEGTDECWWEEPEVLSVQSDHEGTDRIDTNSTRSVHSSPPCFSKAEEGPRVKVEAQYDDESEPYHG